MAGSKKVGSAADSERIDGVLLAAARSGDRSAQDALLGTVMRLLRAHAARRLDGRLRARLDPSDVVQLALIEAARDFGAFEGRTQAELRAWLLEILRTSVLDVIKEQGAQRRNADLERPLDELMRSTVRGRFASPDTSPSRKVARRQLIERVLARMDQLPEAQRQALSLRVLGEMSVKQIAERMDKSTDAVGALLKRALKQIRTGESHGPG